MMPVNEYTRINGSKWIRAMLVSSSHYIIGTSATAVCFGMELSYAYGIVSWNGLAS
jgi:hypothetical protein